MFWLLEILNIVILWPYIVNFGRIIDKNIKYCPFWDFHPKIADILSKFCENHGIFEIQIAVSLVPIDIFDNLNDFLWYKMLEECFKQH